MTESSEGLLGFSTITNILLNEFLQYYAQTLQEVLKLYGIRLWV
jgi:hypothetical protein